MSDLRLSKQGKVNIDALKGGIKKAQIKDDKEMKAIFDSIDVNKDGVLDADEVKKFKTDILGAAGNDKLSKREAGKYLKQNQMKHLDKKDLFEFINLLSQSGENIKESTYKTDANGNKTVFITYNDDSIETIHPNQTREVATKGENGETITKTYKKDSNKPSSIKITYPDGSTETTTLDENEKPIEKIVVQKNGVTVKTKYEGNKQTEIKTIGKGGNPVETITLNDEEKPETRTVQSGTTLEEYSYDENENPVLNKKVENQGIPAKEKITEYTYNQDGTITENIKTANGSSVITRFENGSYTETIQDGNNTTETTYNKEDKRLSQTKTVDGETYTVQYDGNGNTLVTVQNGESIEVLAQKFGCTAEEIINANKEDGTVKGGKNNQYFLVGQEIKIPKELEADEKALQGRLSSEETIQDYTATMEAKRAEEARQAQEASEANETPAEEKKLTSEELKAKQQQANIIAKDLYSACQRAKMRTVDSDAFQAELKKVNSENASMVLSQFNAESLDLSYVDMICSQQTSSEAKRKDALTHMMNALADEARAKGVAEADITKYTKSFEISMNAEFKKIGFIDPKNMEASMKALHGLVLAKDVDAIEMTNAEAIESFKGTAQGEYDSAKSSFDEARKDEEWTARAGDTVFGWFGCITKEDMEGKLAEYKGDIEKLQNCKSEAEFKQVYEDVFGIPFDKKKIAAYETAKIELGLAASYKNEIETLQNLYNEARGLDYESYKAKVVETLGDYKPEEIDAIVDSMAEEYMKKYKGSDKKDVLRHFIDLNKQQQAKLYEETTKGRSLEQMQAEVDSVRQSAFGTKDIVNDVIKYNQNQEMTGMVVEMAGEIAATAVLQAIPGLGQMAAAKLAVSAAKWGTRGAKFFKNAKSVTNLVTKTTASLENTAKKLDKVNKAINSTKATRIGTNTASAFVGTTGVDLSNGKSVKDALYKGLQNAIFAGAGGFANEFAPVIAKTYGVSGKVAKEIAEEITEAALDVSSSAAISVAMIGDYTSDDAFMDLATGIIMNRLGKIGVKNAGNSQNAPSQTPVLDKASSKGKATPSSVKVGDKKAQQIKQEVDDIVSNSNVSGEDLAKTRQEVGGMQKRDVRRDAERKIDNAADNLDATEKAKFDAARKADAENNVNHIFEKHSELNDSDTRVLNEYINTADNVEVLNNLKQQLADKEHTYGGVTANYDRLRNAIDKKVAELQPTPVKTNAEQRENVVKMLNEKATTGKGLNETEFKDLTTYISTIDNANDLKEIKGLLGGKKMTSAQKKELKEALSAKTEALKDIPTPVKADIPEVKAEPDVKPQTEVKPVEEPKVEVKPEQEVKPETEVKPEVEIKGDAEVKELSEKIADKANKIEDIEVPKQYKELWADCKKQLQSLYDKLPTGEQALKQIATLGGQIKKIANSATGVVKAKFDEILADLKTMFEKVKTSMKSVDLKEKASFMMKPVKAFEIPKDYKLISDVDGIKTYNKEGFNGQSFEIKVKDINGKPQKISETLFDNNELVNNKTFDYDKQGHLLSSISKNKDGGIEHAMFVDGNGVEINYNVRNGYVYASDFSKKSSDSVLSGEAYEMPLDILRKVQNGENPKLNGRDLYKLNELPEGNIKYGEFKLVTSDKEADEVFRDFVQRNSTRVTIADNEDVYAIITTNKNSNAKFNMREGWAKSYQDGNAKQNTPWKIHLYANSPQEWANVAQLAMPYLDNKNIDYKTISNFADLQALAKDTQKGKAFTVYFETEEQFVQVAKDLEKIFDASGLKSSGKVAVEGQIGDSGFVSYRHEGAARGHKYKPDNVEDPLAKSVKADEPEIATHPQSDDTPVPELENTPVPDVKNSTVAMISNGIEQAKTPRQIGSLQEQINVLPESLEKQKLQVDLDAKVEALKKAEPKKEMSPELKYMMEFEKTHGENLAKLQENFKYWDTKVLEDKLNFIESTDFPEQLLEIANNGHLANIEYFVKIANDSNINDLAKLTKNKNLGIDNGVVSLDDFEDILKYANENPQMKDKILDIASKSNRGKDDIPQIVDLTMKYPNNADDIVALVSTNPNVKVGKTSTGSVESDIDEIIGAIRQNPNLKDDIMNYMSVQRKDKFDTSSSTKELQYYVQTLKEFPNLRVQINALAKDANLDGAEIHNLVKKYSISPENLDMVVKLAAKGYEETAINRKIASIIKNPDLQGTYLADTPDYTLIDETSAVTPVETVQKRFAIREKLEAQFDVELSNLKATLGDEFYQKVKWEKIIPANATNDEIEAILKELNESSKFFARTKVNERKYGKNIAWASEMNMFSDVAAARISNGEGFRGVIDGIASDYRSYDVAKTLDSNTGIDDRRKYSGEYRGYNNDNGATTPFNATGSYSEYNDRFTKMLQQAEAGNPRVSPYPDVELTDFGVTNRGNCMIHPKSRTVEPGMNHIQDRFDELKPLFEKVKNGKNLTPEEIKMANDKIAESYYLMANIMPWARGSNGISDIYMRSMYKALGIDQPALKKGVSLDLEAFCMSLDDYKAQWNSFFEPQVVKVEVADIPTPVAPVKATNSNVKAETPAVQSSVKANAPEQKLDWDIAPDPKTNHGFKRNVNAKTDIEVLKSDEILIGGSMTGYSHFIGSPVFNDIDDDLRNAILDPVFGKGIKECSVYNAEKNMTAFEFSVLDCFRRPGIFSVMVKGQVSEVDAKGLMDHLRSKNLIPRQASDDYRDMLLLAGKVKEETMNYFNNLRTQKVNNPVEVETSKPATSSTPSNTVLTSEHRIAMNDISTRLHTAKTPADLDKLEKMLENIPDCVQKKSLQTSIEIIRSQLSY